MNKELELKLVEKYPKILKEYGGDKTKTCMHWGMECGDGWYTLLDETMQKIQYICDTTHVQVVAEQVKEKFGTLRFYYRVETNFDIIKNVISSVVNDAEKQSMHVCENTGKIGYKCQSPQGYLRTLSKEEADKEGYTPTNPSIAKYWDTLDEKQPQNIIG
jgi:hypothetical protein